MKKFLFFALSICSFNAIAQYDCSTSDSFDGLRGTGAGCTDYLNYIPDINHMDYSPDLLYKVNFHIFRNTDGSGMYQPSQIADIENQITYVNQHYTNMASPSLPISPPAQLIPDTKIRFELQNVYWHDDDTYYNYGDVCGSGPYSAYAVNTDSEINVFFMGNTSVGAACGPYGRVNMFATTFGWASSQLLAHELGHVVGLPHTFSGCSDDIYSDTYHPDSNGDWLDCGTTEAYPQCGGGTGISNNIMGYNKCRAYLSPMQIAQIRYRAIQLPTYRKFLKPDYDATQTVEIVSNETWEHANYLTGDLIVKSGYQLTVKCTLFLSSESKIIVEPNAKLIIDGGVLTSNKDDARWDGIYVSGNSTASQAINSTLFGKVVLKNGARLENADQAVNNWGLTAGGNLDWDAIGGIIQATDAVFYNNWHGARFKAYTNKNSSGNPINDKSYFRKCEFSIDDDMINGDHLYAFIEQWKTRGVDIFGCTFTNTQSVFEHERGTGILNHDAVCRIKDHCNSIYYPCPLNYILWLV